MTDNTPPNGDERFHLLVDSVRDYAIFMLDPRGHVATWNAGAERIKGYTPEEIIGQHFSRFYPPEDVAAGVPARVLANAAREGSSHLEGWRVRKDGTRFWGEVTITAIRQNGQLLGFSKVTRDLTDRHAAEEALRLSEERFRLFVESVVDYAIYALDPLGFITTWNAGAERLKGYTAAEIIGQHFSRFYPPEDVAAGKPQRLLNEALHKGRVEEENWRIRKDGTPFWANVVITALRDPVGKLIGFGKVTRDLTTRRQTEEERRRRLAAEEAAQLRSEFLSIAAHELKTPLTSLRGMAQLTLRRYQREGSLSPDRMRQALAVVDEQSGKLARLVEQLLDTSRLESGHLILERATTDLAILLRSVVTMFSGRPDGSRVSLTVPHHTVAANVDSLRLEQVVTNLVDNALKYSPSGSPVSVTLSDEPGGTVRIAVEDRGPGIPAEDRPHLFDRFFRSRTATHTAGLGIGLYVSRQIVELHGGVLAAEFPEGGGTRMVVTLPPPPPESDPADPADPATRAASATPPAPPGAPAPQS